MGVGFGRCPFFLRVLRGFFFDRSKHKILRGGHDQLSTAQKFGVGLLYAAIAVLGAAYAVFEDHQANRLVPVIKEMMPAFLILALVVVVYVSLRMSIGFQI